MENVPTSLYGHFLQNSPFDGRDPQQPSQALSIPYNLGLSTKNIQAMANQRKLSIRPTGADPGATDDIIQLSDMDHLMPKLYVHMIEIFELPEDSIRDSVVKTLISGLERALADYPILTGQEEFKLRLL